MWNLSCVDASLFYVYFIANGEVKRNFYTGKIHNSNIFWSTILDIVKT
jgi:hypothetical protein